MITCIVPGCQSNTTEDLSTDFFLFPKNLELCQLWVEACSLGDIEINLEEDVICSLHFDESSFRLESEKKNKAMYFYKKLEDDAIPSLHLPIKSTEENNMTKSSVKHPDQLNITHDLASSSSNFLLQSNAQLRQSSTDPYRNTKYDYIKTAYQLENLKDLNKKLVKQIADVEKDLVIQRNVYEESLKEHTDIRNKLRKYARHVFSEQRSKEILSKVFSETQIKVLLGKKKTYWSDHDMAVAYTIRHLSNVACYNYLIKNMNIPLPGLSSIKRWINVKNLGKKKVRKPKTDPKSGTAEIVNSAQVVGENEQFVEENEEFLEENEEFVGENEEFVEENEEFVGENEEFVGEITGFITESGEFVEKSELLQIHVEPTEENDGIEVDNGIYLEENDETMEEIEEFTGDTE